MDLNNVGRCLRKYILEYFGEKQESGFIDICPQCRKNNRDYVKNIVKKYGIYG
jgi:superfamily II DNA helicase RecQ